MRLLTALLPDGAAVPEGFFWLGEAEARGALPTAMGRLLALAIPDGMTPMAQVAAPAGTGLLAGEAPAMAPRATPARGRPRGAPGSGPPKRRTKP